MIDRGDIRQAIDEFTPISGLHCRALVMVSSAWADSLIAKFKEAGEQSEIDVWYDHADYLRSG